MRIKIEYELQYLVRYNNLIVMWIVYWKAGKFVIGTIATVVTTCITSS